MRSRPRWMLVWLTLLLAAFVGHSFSSWPAILVLLSLSLLGIALTSAKQGSVASDSRPAAPSLVHRLFVWIFGLCLVLLVCSTRAVPYLQNANFNPLNLGADVLSHAALTTILILLGLRAGQGHPAMLGLALAATLFCAAAGGSSQSIRGQTTVAFCTCTGFLIASQIILGRQDLELHRESRSGPRASPGFSVLGNWNRTSMLLSTLTLSAILISTGLLTRATSESLPQIQQIVHSKLKNSLDQMVNGQALTGTRYVFGATIGSIRGKLLANPNEIALRVFSNSSPGYLRGHAFDSYASGQWQTYPEHQPLEHFQSSTINHYTVRPNGPATTAIVSSNRLHLKRFNLFPSINTANNTIEVRNVPLKGSTIFFPLGTQWLEASSIGISLSHQQTVLHGINVNYPYVAGVASRPAPETLEQDRQRLMLLVPEKVRIACQPIVNDICDEQSPPREKARQIESFFAANFSYSLEHPKAPSSEDPLLYFLQTRHQAHCEFFATATAMMLRCAGVPTRYVTGYVADEWEPTDSYWIARNRDAHAWVEAYDHDSRTWFPVESTPGRHYQTLSLENTQNLASAVNSEEWINQQSDDTSWLSSVWSFMAVVRSSNPVLILFQFAQAPLFLLITVMLWRRYNSPSANQENPEDIRSRKLLRRVDRRMRRLSLVRGSSETMHQFANRIENSYVNQQVDATEWPTNTANWYRQFAEARYRGEQPPEISS
ncbi:Protein-glutamine gamma-glutamyltransferase [Planctomycetes bacterium CA13]|uniref:Protein-glutamine gamma-glutamyltransferase n=1 Tax=Novipirellula herctigrandis TaxID=2527986 RepID=A0A5C5Z429_9BACT|nr:Protein-glutamine gamma-glutamyltransferase [Planctomycetes bacterium CA13]